MARRIYITGASGALGAELALRLSARPGTTPLAVSRAPCPAPVPALRVDDYADAEWWDPADHDAPILHAAGLARPGRHFADFRDLARQHIEPHLQMLDRLIDRGWRGPLLFLSSAAVYGEAAPLPIPETAPCNPLSAYGLSKLCLERGFADRAARDGVPVAILRLSNLYGARYPGRSGPLVVELIRDAIACGTPFCIFGDGRSRRDYLHVTDLAGAVEAVLAADLPPGGSVINIGSGRSTSLVDLVQQVAVAAGRSPEIAFLPERPEARSSVLDVTWAAERLGWRPRIGLAEGLAMLPPIR